GLYRKDHRSGAMHSRQSLLKELRYGSDTRHLYVRVDFTQPITAEHNLEFRLEVKNQSGQTFQTSHIWKDGQFQLKRTELPSKAVRAALDAIYEAEIPLSEVDAKYGDVISVNVSVFREGLPVAALPPTGDL